MEINRCFFYFYFWVQPTSRAQSIAIKRKTSKSSGISRLHQFLQCGRPFLPGVSLKKSTYGLELSWDRKLRAFHRRGRSWCEGALSARWWPWAGAPGRRRCRRRRAPEKPAVAMHCSRCYWWRPPTRHRSPGACLLRPRDRCDTNISARLLAARTAFSLRTALHFHIFIFHHIFFFIFT